MLKVKKIQIKNFKSLSQNHNELILDDKMTILLGVNESGKSNIIDAIGNVKLLSTLPKYYKENINVSCEKEDNVELTFFFEDEEGNETIITYKHDYYPQISGNLIKRFNTNDLIKDFINFVDQMSNGYYSTEFSKCVDILQHKDILFTNYRNIFTEAYKVVSGKFLLGYSLEDLLEEIEKIYGELPIIVSMALDFKELKGIYTFKEILDAKTNSFISRFLDLCKISKTDIENLPELSESKFETQRRALVEKIRKSAIEPFTQYYNHEDLHIEIDITKNALKIFGVTDEKYVVIDQRSQGLKWYFMFYVFMRSNSIKLDENFLFLFDEPGIYLHINAQKELLKFLRELCESNSQVIFSTHLPFMIENDNLNNLRAIIKNEKGDTQIYNNIFSNAIPVLGKNNTLAPVFKSIGFDLSNSVYGDGLLNVLVEGITDKIILDAMNKVLYNKKVNFIPCGGASNLKNVLSLMVGFNYDFIIFFDADKPGIKEAENISKNFSIAVKDKVFFINGSSIENPERDDFTIEKNISDLDMKKFDNILDGTSESKKNFALEFRKKVVDKEIPLETITIQNFNKIFAIIESKLSKD